MYPAGAIFEGSVYLRNILFLIGEEAHVVIDMSMICWSCILFEVRWSSDYRWGWSCILFDVRWSSEGLPFRRRWPPRKKSERCVSAAGNDDSTHWVESEGKDLAAMLSTDCALNRACRCADEVELARKTAGRDEFAIRVESDRMRQTTQSEFEIQIEFEF